MWCVPLTWGSTLERVTRIELALSAWEADVLPLNYTRERPERLLRARAYARQTDLPRHRTGSRAVPEALRHRHSADSGPVSRWKR